MIRLILTMLLSVLGFCMGVGLAHATTAVMGVEDCTATGDNKVEDSFTNAQCSMTVSLTLKTKYDGGMEDNCEPIEECEVVYDFDGSWTAGWCVSDVDYYENDEWIESINIPSGSTGPGANATTTVWMSCPDTKNCELRFNWSAFEGRCVLLWECKCLPCPTPPN
jgi:hypothetical protein